MIDTFEVEGAERRAVDVASCLDYPRSRNAD